MRKMIINLGLLTLCLAFGQQSYAFQRITNNPKCENLKEESQLFKTINYVVSTIVGNSSLVGKVKSYGKHGIRWDSAYKSFYVEEEQVFGLDFRGSVTVNYVAIGNTKYGCGVIVGAAAENHAKAINQALKDAS